MEANNSSTTYEKGQLYQLNLNDLRADPDQPRKVMDAQGLEDMTASAAPAVASSAAVEAVPAVTAAPATKKTSKKPA